MTQIAIRNRLQRRVHKLRKLIKTAQTEAAGADRDMDEDTAPRATPDNGTSPYTERELTNHIAMEDDVHADDSTAAPHIETTEASHITTQTHTTTEIVKLSLSLLSLQRNMGTPNPKLHTKMNKALKKLGLMTQVEKAWHKISNPDAPKPTKTTPKPTTALIRHHFREVEAHNKQHLWWIDILIHTPTALHDAGKNTPTDPLHTFPTRPTSLHNTVFIQNVMQTPPPPHTTTTHYHHQSKRMVQQRKSHKDHSR
jgi:hypothetical protein